MASTTRSSPTSDASAPSSPCLTPRSKLKAELAALDDSSDEDTGPIDRKTLFKSLDKVIEKSEEPVQAHNSSVEEEEDEEEEEDIIRPRGRLVARMQADISQKQSAGPISLHGLPETATESISPTQDSDADADSEDAEDIIVAPRRRRIRATREATPHETLAREDSPASPGLFVSPNKSQRSDAGSGSDDELPQSLAQNARFKALVARKREERLAREAEEKQKRDEKSLQRVQVSDDEDDDDDVSDISDDEGGRKLTQEVSSRPAVRKAGKKALEDMNRETQRLSRSMQLAHEAKTKKKISKSTLFERFNFKLPGVEPVAEVAAEVVPITSSSRPVTPGSVKDATDVEMADKETPPSSPPSVLRKAVERSMLSPAKVQEAQTQLDEEAEEDLPALGATVLAQAKILDKGKEIATPGRGVSPRKKTPMQPRRLLRVKFPAVQANLATIDLDDDLQIAKPKKQSRLDSIFERIPAQQGKEVASVHVLRQLAHLSSPPQDARKRNQKPSMTVGQLQLNLQQRARAQAKLERERRMEMLKAKGIHVQTSEEREKEREEVEDIVSRARQEAEEIMAREREDAKKAKAERKAHGEDDHLDWDDSDGESFAASDDEELQPIAEGDIEFSGSDDENEEDGDDEEGEGAEVEDEPAANPMFDEDADEADESEDDTPQATKYDLVDDEDEDMDDIQPTTSKSRRGKKHIQIVSDDEGETMVEATPRPKNSFRSTTGLGTDSPKVPTSVLRSATKTFIPGLSVPVAGPAGMGLTQIFAGTMDDSQVGSASPTTGSPMQFMPSFNNFPDSQFSATAGETQPVDDLVLDSQTGNSKYESQTQGLHLNFEQSQTHGFDSIMQLDATQASDMLDATQDAGFAAYTPLKQRFVDPPQGTVDTVLLNATPVLNTDADAEVGQAESPLVRRRGKLQRRGQVSFADLDLPATATPASPVAGRPVPASTAESVTDTQEDPASAFKFMTAAARKTKRALEKFNKKNSRAKAMVQGEADESEDEYAGLGGADGEDSSEADEDDLAELRKQMIDDESKGMTEEEQGKLAALFADHERAADSAQVDKLFRDITTGMLRKRRRGGGNGDFDLSDSDDGGEARRRLKRKQFAKMQKALFADERLGKIAENPRNSAFMKSIEDLGSDEEMGFDEPYFVVEEESQPQEASQSKQGESEESIPNSQPIAIEAPGGNLGRKRTRNEPSEPAARPAPNMRRTRDGARPASLADVRRSLTSLLGEPNMSLDSVIPATDPHGSDSEGEVVQAREEPHSSNKENRLAGYVSVVDRISLKRSGTSSLSNSSKLAFAAPASASTGGGTFKVPALLRRATTNSSLVSQSSKTSSTGVTIGAGAGAGGKSSFGEEGKLKKNAGKKSGVNFFARENERREKLKVSDRRREEKKWKGVEGRSKAVGGLFGGGRFE